MKRRLLAIVFAMLMLCTLLSFSILATDITPGENETEDFPWGDAEPEDPAPAYTPGDINGDEAVDMMDVTALLQVVNMYEVDCVEDACDPNGDAATDMMDVTLLLQAVNQYDVELQ